MEKICKIYERPTTYIEKFCKKPTTTFEIWDNDRLSTLDKNCKKLTLKKKKKIVKGWTHLKIFL